MTRSRFIRPPSLPPAAQARPLPAGRKRARVVRRDLEVLEVELRNLGEGRSGHRTAPDDALRLVHGDENDEARMRRRYEPDERRDVSSRGIAAVRIRLLGS